MSFELHGGRFGNDHLARDTSLLFRNAPEEGDLLFVEVVAGREARQPTPDHYDTLVHWTHCDEAILLFGHAMLTRSCYIGPGFFGHRFE